MESTTSIKFTTTQKMKITIYGSTTDSNCDIKIDGTKVMGDISTHTITSTLEAGAHELTKQSTNVTVMFIKLEPAE